MKLNRMIAGAFVACSMVATSAFADLVTLNPSAANAGAVGGTVLSALNGPFVTDKATTNFASRLTINSAPGAAGLVTATETGFFLVDAFAGVPLSGVGINYNIYALFTITGNGTWLGGSNFFSANALGLTLEATLYGSPGSGSVGAVTPSAGNPFGIIPNADFVLGTASLIQGQIANALVGIPTVGGPAIGAATGFQAVLGFTAAAGTTGPGGFWQAPFPFVVNLGNSATGTALIGGNGTSFVVSGGQTIITTNVTALGAGSGSGNIIFDTNQVPEPGSLALVGLALLGLGATRRHFGTKA